MERYTLLGKDECHGLLARDWYRRGTQRSCAWDYRSALRSIASF